MTATLTAGPAVAGPEAGPDQAPPAGSSRIPALDVLRGIAILGTLATNIGIFVATSGEGPEGIGGHPFSQFVATAVGLLTDGKYIGLLTIMFGIGLEIQRQSAVRRGDPWLGSYPWRAALLCLDGLLNYIFIFEYDVLMGYALTGLVMCAVLTTTPRFQKWFLGMGLAAHVGYLSYFSGIFSGSNALNPDPEIAALLEKDPLTLTPAQLDQVAQATGLSTDELVGSAADMASDWAPHTDSYWSMVHDRVLNFWGGRGEIPIMFTMGMGLFLVGAFLYRAGLFAPAGRRLRLWIMGLSFGIGLPLDWVTRLWFSEYTSMYNRYLTSAFVSIGILALVAHFYARPARDGSSRSTGLVGGALSRVGKMALSCYVAQNLIASILFYNWGLGLADKLAPFGLGIWSDLAAWVLVSAILIAFATLWQRHFRRGPLEWLWHVSHTWLMAHTTLKWRANRAHRQVAH